jgi:hypothetical protein
VAADIGGGVAEFIKADSSTRSFQRLVDVLGGDAAPRGVEWVSVVVYAMVKGASVGEDVVDSPG